jgi:hypothetical protein
MWTLAADGTGRPPGTLPIVLASIALDFDAQATLFGADYRLETLALAGVLFAALVFAGLSAGRPAAGLFDRRLDDGSEPPKLRRDDLILIAFGIVPGAVVGGRIDYVLVHLDFYRAHSDSILDVNQGGLNLTLAVVLGTICGIAVARLMNAPVGRWLSVTATPAMLALGLGKLAMVLGGAGQGTYSDAWWATSYAGRGPWESLNPTYPSLPSQAFEGLLVLAALAVVLALPPLLRLRLRRWRRFVRPGIAPRHRWRLLTGGRRFLTMIGIWATMRFAAASTWRDAHVAGSLNAEQLLLLAVIACALFGPTAVSALGWLVRHLATATAAGSRALTARWAARRNRVAPAESDAAEAPADSDVAKPPTVSDAGGGLPGPSGNDGAAFVHEVKLPVEDA